MLTSVTVRLGLFVASTHGLWFIPNPKPGESRAMLRMLRFADNQITDVVTVDFVPTAVGMSISPDERAVLLTRRDQGGTDLLLVNDFR